MKVQVADPEEGQNGEEQVVSLALSKQERDTDRDGQRRQKTEICETGDRLGTDRLLPPSQEGDVILIANAGAYGYVMSSNYNRREVAPEIVI